MSRSLSPQQESALRHLAGQTFAVKLGGEVMLNSAGLDSLAADIALLAELGVGVVVVHGGGPQADALAGRLGHTVRKVAGRRVTDDNALEVAKMVFGGSINVEILGALKKHGARGVGLSGVDGGLVTVTRRPPRLVKDPSTGAEEWVDYGHVGDVASVDVSLPVLLTRHGYVPVIASLAADAEGRIYNVNADTIAAEVAAAMGCAALLILSNVPGLLRNPADPSSLVGETSPGKIAAMIEAGVISGGMLPKVKNCVDALDKGVASVRILDGSGPRSLLVDALAGDEVGTLVLPDAR